MIIAQEKKKTNIAEYILYMWQVEDIIRASNFNISIIEENIIKQMKLEAIQYNEVKIWYEDLISRMKSEKITKSGHLSFVTDTLNELELFHKSIIEGKKDKKYLELYKWAMTIIKELSEKNKGHSQGEIDVCLTGLYGLLILRLRKKTISAETAEAMKTISNLVAYLSMLYMKK